MTPPAQRGRSRHSNSRGGGRQTSVEQPQLQCLHAPYNFVPLAEDVFLPAWGPQASHDVPFEDGLSGTIGFKLVAHTPLCVGGERYRPDRTPQQIHFQRLPDDAAPVSGSGRRGTPMIQGAEIRGMIRNVLEIASFSRFQFIDDTHYGIRDLAGPTRDAYADKMTRQVRTADNNTTFEPRSRAGWMYFSDGRWRIQPCSFARITYGRLQDIGNVRIEGPQQFRLAKKKYNTWLNRNKNLKITFVPGAPEGPNQLAFTEVYLPHERPTESTLQGTLVFTGTANPNKRREFVFHSPEQRELVPSDDVVQGFFDVHERIHQSEDWEYWRKRHFASRGHKRIPVFFLVDENSQEVTGLGLALMFKLAYPNSTHDIRANTARLHGAAEGSDPHAPDPARPDLAETIFGRIDADGQHSARGRVSFSTMRLENPRQAKSRMSEPIILNAPKASYFPCYVVQGPLRQNGLALVQGAAYQTFMNDDAELRGWKRYPARPPEHAGEAPIPPAVARNTQVQQQIELLEAQQPDQSLSFVGTLRFHNLRPAELGAVLWAMTFGQDANKWHGLGLAKSMGFGLVSLELDDDKDSRILANDGRSPPSVETCIAAFEDCIDKWLASRPRTARLARRWRDTSQYRTLLTLADPSSVTAYEPVKLQHLTLSDFPEAKKLGLVLRSVGANDNVGGGGAVAPRRASDRTPAPKKPAPPPPSVGTLRFPAGTPVEYVGLRHVLLDDVFTETRRVRVRDDDGEEDEADVSDLKPLS